ncbi:MAG: cell division protein SepF [Halobacteriales archaeon]|nr:cell division protein SepF [Halobacteriales archaeon]
MGLVKRLMGEEKTTSKADFMDLGEYNVEVKQDEPASTLIKVAELSRIEDVADLAEQVYGGHILILDIRPVAKDEFQLKRVTAELKKVASDVGGDVAGIGDGLIAITPRGIKVDRQKIRLSA